VKENGGFQLSLFPQYFENGVCSRMKNHLERGGEGRIRIGVEGFQRSFNYVESQAILIVEEVSYRIELRV